jgi:hypothetical protein
MCEMLAVLSGAISGACLATIALRKKLPLIGTLASPRVKVPLDRTDRRLALISLVFFLLCLAFVAVLYS